MKGCDVCTYSTVLFLNASVSVQHYSLEMESANVNKSPALSKKLAATKPPYEHREKSFLSSEVHQAKREWDLGEEYGSVGPWFGFGDKNLFQHWRVKYS